MTADRLGDESFYITNQASVGVGNTSPFRSFDTTLARKMPRACNFGLLICLFLSAVEHRYSLISARVGYHPRRFLGEELLAGQGGTK